MEPILFCWSGGKDSAYALHTLRASGLYDVRALLTTVTGEYNRISMHGVRVELAEKQAAAVGIPLEKSIIHKGGSNDDYEKAMTDILLKYNAQGVKRVAFGDLFLEDIRSYREAQIAKVGMECLFPLWGRNTKALAQSFISDGFRTIITCVDTTLLDGSFAGREFDESFLADLPDSVDPCGENGEFHSFVFDGPLFDSLIAIEIGEKVLRDSRYMYCDVLGTRRGCL